MEKKRKLSRRRSTMLNSKDKSAGADNFHVKLLTVTFDGEFDKVFVTTHVDNGNTPLSIAIEQIKKKFNYPESEKIRIFSSETGEEVKSKGGDEGTLDELSYVCTDKGKDLGFHEHSIFGATEEIKGIKPHFLLGNFGNLPKGNDAIVLKFVQLVQEKSPVEFQCLKFYRPGLNGANGCIFINMDPDLTHFITTREDLFDKLVPGVGSALYVIREYGAKKGIFVAGSEEKDWQIAHRILLPAFSMKGMQMYYPVIQKQISRVIKHLDSFKPKQLFDITDMMTRMTLDTIGLAGFDFEFGMLENISYIHPFVQNMTTFLSNVQDFLGLDPVSRYFKKNKYCRTMLEANASMEKIVKDVIDKRIASGDRKNDILDLMLNASDPMTGEKLPFQSVLDQLITFLIAGHETTSGMLSFTWYLLSQNPEAEKKLMAEVDYVLGRDPDAPIEWKDVSKLKYLDMVLKESLRLYPTASAFSKVCLRDAKYGKYLIKKGSIFMNVTWGLHRNPKCFDDPLAFKPERFASYTDKHPGAYFPFGSGQRSCIGMQFAMIESKVAMAAILRKYRVICPPDYKFQTTFMITIKPTNLKMYLEPRDMKEDLSPFIFDFEKGKIEYNKKMGKEEMITPAPSSPSNNAAVSSGTFLSSTPHDYKSTPLFIYYGSNMGASESFAKTIQARITKMDIPCQLGEMDDFVNDMSNTKGRRTVLIVTSSYNGKSPNNGLKFFNYLTNLVKEGPNKLLSNIKYAVFGCGNTSWESSYQAIPIFTDDNLALCGGERIIERGFADADSGSFEDSFDEWSTKLYSLLSPSDKRMQSGALAKSEEAEDNSETYVVKEIEEKDAVITTLYGGFNDDKTESLTVISSTELLTVDPESHRSTKHIQIQLPSTMTYEAGDHLAIWPVNSNALVEAFCKRMGWNPDSMISISKNNSRINSVATRRSVSSVLGHLKGVAFPLENVITIRSLITDFVDITGPVSRKTVFALSFLTDCPPEAKALQKASESSASFKESEILIQKKTLLQVLNDYRSVMFSVSVFLSFVTPLKLRYYSISSSPMCDGANIAHLTVSKLIWTDKSSNEREGISSTYLNHVTSGDVLHGFVKDAAREFHLPSDPSIPCIYVGPGTGIAPLRGFIREREEISKREKVGESLLFFGCRNSTEDNLYKTEWEAMINSKLVVHAAFSRQKDTKKTYVQDLIEKEHELVYKMISGGAHIYICGDAKNMAPAVKQAFIKVINKHGGSGDKLINDLVKNSRYAQDVWASAS